ncbi:alkaline phosphatase [Kineococcus rubinsiae]|uniref:alkaline phosphatase n=1 Tax=Kineococcus rubinsiae TaxID=2609562 RepID=UPI00142F77C8|nr:alkaline phosphatase [Kineococcus rubinsiae]NIZ90083.1 alkaline phosphatase [Kineococcus rubinsiae]
MPRSSRPSRPLLGAATLIALAATAAACGVQPAPTADPAGGPRHARAKNVVVLQGDGMGIAHRELVRLATKGQDEELAMDSLDVAGWVHTDPLDPEDTVTDSAASATAFATGVRTYNGAVGVDADGRALPTLLEQARRAGKATGLVTTSQVTDATPAAYGSHVPDRDDQSEIARQFIEETRPDVVLGGGEDRWLPPGEEGAWPDHPATDPTEESAGTQGNLIERAQELGYHYVSDAEGLAAARPRGRLLGLFANEEMFEHRNEGPDALYDPAVPLRDMASKALDVLSRDRDGFFLLVEEEGVDEMAHHNNAHLTIEAGAALDSTVQLVLDFAETHPDTLVVVVGDHETGGLAIENPDADDESGDGESTEDGPFTVAGTDLEFVVDWTTEQHTGAATPLTAQGPGADRLGRVQDSTDVHDAIAAAMLGRR